MRDQASGSGWRYVLQPWRYDFEATRDWRAASFPLYGLIDDRTLIRRMGGKSCVIGGSSSLARFVPEDLRRALIGLEVIEIGDGWQVRIDSHDSPRPVPQLGEQSHRWRAGRSYAGPPSPDGDGWPRSCEIQVNDEACQFDGWQREQVWSGQSANCGLAITVVTDSIDPETLTLRQITDPTPYLRGQREFMKRRS